MPRPNYRLAVLWRRLMGPAALDPGPPPAPEPGTTPEEAFPEGRLGGTGRVEAFYAGLRGRLAPGKTPRQLPLPGSAWTPGQRRRAGGRPQRQLPAVRARGTGATGMSAA